MRPPADLDAVVAAVQAGAGYRELAEELVRSVAAAELAKRRSGKEAVKATRAKLHQLVGAYEELPRDALARVAALAEGDDPRAVARDLMAAHASTRERLDLLDSFWSVALAGLAPPASVLDLACGLNPLALDWMALPADTCYRACDVHRGQLALVETWLARRGQPHEVFPWDLLAGPPPGQADLVLLLKTIPCLEQADRQAGRRLLAGLQARTVLVSYPLRSLGGRQVGMESHYAGRFAELLAGLPWTTERLPIEGELVYRLAQR